MHHPYLVVHTKWAILGLGVNHSFGAASRSLWVLGHCELPLRFVIVLHLFGAFLAHKGGNDTFSRSCQNINKSTQAMQVSVSVEIQARLREGFGAAL